MTKTLYVSGFLAAVLFAILPALLVAQEAPAHGTKGRNFESPFGAVEATSKDRSLIAHFSAEFPPALYIRDSSTGGEKKLAESPKGPDAWLVVSSLAFSPDGSHLIFAAGPPRQYDGAVYTIGIDGSGLKKLAEDVQLAESDNYVSGQARYDMGVYNPSYSPDGKKVVVDVEITDGRRDDGGRIEDGPTRNYVGVLSPEAEKQKPSRLGEGTTLFWSADSQGIYYISKGLVLSKIDSLTKKITPIADAKHLVILGRIDGTDTIFMRYQSDTGVRVMSLDGTAVSQDLRNFATKIKVTDSDGRALTSIQSAGSAHQFNLVYELPLPSKDPNTPRTRNALMNY